MKMYPRSGEKRRFDDMDLEDEEAIGTLCRLSGSGHASSPVCTMENEKRIRREIANSNERRRMQSINAGFASLKQLLPNTDGEKLSKAAILQQTADYIFRLEQERKELIHQNNKLKKYLQQQESTDGSSSENEAPMREIISTLQDHSSSLLPNTEFLHRKTEMITPASGVDVEHQPHTLVQEVGAMEEVSAIDLKDDDYIPQSPSDEMVHIKMDFDYEKKSRTFLGDKVKALIYPNNKKQHHIVDYSEDDLVFKSEPVSTIVDYETTTYSAAKGGNGVQRIYPSGANTGLSKQINTNHHRLPQPNTTPATIVTILPPHHHNAAVSTVNMTSSGLKPIHKRHAPAAPTSSLIEVSSTPPHTISEGRLSAPPLPKVEVEPTSRIPTPEQVEYLHASSNSSPSHHGGITLHPNESASNIMIMSSKSNNNQSSQKSLDSICEAIRHLEGDLMFSNDNPHPEQQQQHIVTTEQHMEQPTATYEIQESTHGEDGGTYLHHQEIPLVNSEIIHRGNKVYSISTPKIYTPSASPPSSTSSSIPRQNTLHLHHSGNIIYGIEKHLIPSEPQEVPLELTTSHRIERINPQPPRSTPHSFIQRPGVIVVKQA